jgi:glycine cleavage system aminomethyltransferase T
MLRPVSVVGLDTVARRAGAVTTNRDGAEVPAHYGSPAAELAVCLAAVGLGDRSDLAKLTLNGPPLAVAGVMRRMTGMSLAPRGVCFSGGAWWCAAAPDWVIVLCEASGRARLLDLLRSQAHTLPGIRMSDRTHDWAALAVAGSGAMRLLAALGVLGEHDDPRAATPFTCARIADAEVYVLLESDRLAVLLVEAEDAECVWRAVAEEGRRFGLSLVGTEALHRFSMLNRAARPAFPS